MLSFLVMSLPPHVKDAYALTSKEDIRSLYRDWAQTYDAGFGEAQGYDLPRQVALAFVGAGGAGPLLDVGVGTGLVGDHLAALNVAPIDGIVADAGGAGFNVMIDAPEAATHVHSVLERYRADDSVRSKGPIRLTALAVPVGDVVQDVTVDIGDGWPVSPQIKGALKSLPGVVLVEDV